MKKIIKIVFLCSSAVMTVLFGGIIYLNNAFGDSYYITQGQQLELPYDSIISCVPSAKSNAVAVQKSDFEKLTDYDMDISIFGIVPVKTVHVTVSEQQDVVVLGTPFGIKIYTEGVLVVGFNDVIGNNGAVNPAKNAGIKIGDTLVAMNGKTITGNNDVLNYVLSSQGQAIEFTVKRNEKQFSISVTPEMSVYDNNYKLGMWIRDSSAGIGTLTFYSPSLKIAAGLGHGICDVDTGELIPLKGGEFVGAEIVDINKSTKEETGELQGVFSGDKIADFVENSSTGVFGASCCDSIVGQVMPIALKQEIKIGKAEILATLDENGCKRYSCEIEKIYLNDNSKIKNIVVKVTDKELIEKTGGIVQGMSGSPIIQNGKLIGAVTHVLVDDSTRGYGIFAENMLETAQGVSENNKLKDAS